MIEVIEFINSSGISPYVQWTSTLDRVTRARITTAVLRLVEGNHSAAKSVGGGVFELRMHFGPGYRVYFGRDGERFVILLGGGTKQRQQLDIEAARALWKIYKRKGID